MSNPGSGPLVRCACFSWGHLSNKLPAAVMPKGPSYSPYSIGIKAILNAEIYNFMGKVWEGEIV